MSTGKILILEDSETPVWVVTLSTQEMPVLRNAATREVVVGAENRVEQCTYVRGSDHAGRAQAHILQHRDQSLLSAASGAATGASTCIMHGKVSGLDEHWTRREGGTCGSLALMIACDRVSQLVSSTSFLLLHKE